MSLSLILLAAYVIIVLCIGWFSGRGESSEGFLIGGRDQGALGLGISIVMSWAGGGFITFISLLAFTLGWAAFWPVAGVILGLLFLSVYVPRIHRAGVEHKLYTIGDFFRLSCSPRVGAMVATANLIMFVFWLTVQWVAGGLVLAELSGMPYTLSVIVMAVITLVYLLLGGFRAVLRTDIFQFLLFIVIALGAYSFLQGRGGSFDWLPAAKTVSSLGLNGTWTWLVMLFCIVVAGADVWARIYAADSPGTARRAFGWMVPFYILIYIAISFIALLAKAYAPDTAPDQAFLYGLTEMMPQWAVPFAFILFFAAIMSTIDLTVYGAAMTFSNDYGNRLLGWNEQHLRLIVRMVMIGIVVLTAGAALIWTDILDLAFALMAVVLCAGPAAITALALPGRFSEQALFYSILVALLVYGGILAVGGLQMDTGLIPFYTALGVLLAIEGALRIRKGL